MLPEGAHLRDVDSTMFFVRTKALGAYLLLCILLSRDHWISQLAPAPRALARVRALSRAGTLFCFNLVKTKMDASARRGAVVKALAICSRFRFLHLFKDFMLTALDKYFETNDKRVLEAVYAALNRMDLAGLQVSTAPRGRSPADQSSPQLPELMRRALCPHCARILRSPARRQCACSPLRVCGWASSRRQAICTASP
jgi:hypothetical protein